MDKMKVDSLDSDSNGGVNFNTYATKKTIAKGLFDIGLLANNASQLKAVLTHGSAQEYYYATLVLICVSIFLQIVVGVMLFVLGGMKWKSEAERRRADVLNNVTVGFVAAITLVNVFIGAFGIKLSS